MEKRYGPEFCYSLASRRGSRHLTRLYDRYLAPAGITSSQFSILGFLGQTPGMTVVELADEMVMERTTMVRALEPLQRSGLVVKGSEPKGRAVAYFLTKIGIEKFNDACPLWEAAQREFEKEFGERQAASLRKQLLSIGGDCGETDCIR